MTDDGRLEEFMSIDLGRVFQIDHIRVYGDKKKNSEDLSGIRVRHQVGDVGHQRHQVTNHSKYRLYRGAATND